MGHPDDELAALRAEVVRLRARLDRRHRRTSAKAGRNVEIIRLLAEDRRHWTYKRLAGHFDTTAEAARKVVARAKTGH
jgi:hypothetical protein